jgi:hypothetical protein
MKKIVFMTLCFLTPLVASAARLEDVQILSVKPGSDKFEMRVHAKEGEPDSYFFVDIIKSDPEAFEKINLALKKMMQKEKFRLDLDIVSFSMSPSGSSYNSDSVKFSSPMERTPNSEKKPKQK